MASAVHDFVEQHPPAEGDWPVHYQQQDVRDGKRPRDYTLDDPRFVLLLFVRDWRAFGGRIDPIKSGWAREARETLNLAAHNPAAVDRAAARRCVENLQFLVAALSPGTESEFNVLRQQLDEPISPEDAADLDAVERDPFERDDIEENVERNEEAGLAEVDGVHSIPSAGIHRLRLTSGGVTVTVDHYAAINYVLANQGISPILDLTAENDTDDPVTVDAVALEIDGFSDDAGATLTSWDLQPGRNHADLTVLRWQLDHQAFAELEEARSAQIRLTVTSNGRSTTTTGPVRLLARDEWLAEPHPELLSAFIAPNQPEISDLLGEASSLLQRETGDPSLVGYQQDEDRVVETAHAIYRAIAARGIRYVEAPPSFETTGQKVRRPEDVLNQRWGNCLDLSILYAAALEAAGINPVVVICHGHAFAGFLTQDLKLQELALRSPEIMQNLARSGLLVPVELTTTVEGSSSSFADARRATEQYWDQDLDEITALIDVAACHRRIQPMPRVRRDGDAVIIEVQRPAAMALPTEAHSAGRSESVSAADARPPRVEAWRKSLLDLSFRNPLLKLGARSGEQLHIPESAFDDFEDRLADGKPIRLAAGLELDPAAHNGQDDIRRIDGGLVREMLLRENVAHVAKTDPALLRSLDALRRKAKTVQEESGSNNLFITLGALKWRDARGKEALAPLFLMPVRLEGHLEKRYRVVRSGDEVALPNACLIEKLRRDHGIEIPELANPPRDDHGIDTRRVLMAVRREMSVRGLPFTVETHVRLAVLQFSTLEMWRDVSDNWEKLTENPVVRHLVHTPRDTFVDKVADPEIDDFTEAEEHLPIASDGAQLKAIRWAREGKTFVLEGPPGTGKSQTITNMIANALANGKSVLFVAEKQAALEVVRRRLDAAGLGASTLDLHGKDLTVRKVRAQIEAAWNHAVGPQDQYDMRRADIRRHVSDLVHYRDQVHGPGPAQVSLWRAHDRVLQNEGAAVRIAVPRQYVRGEQPLDSALSVVREVQRAARELSTSLVDSPWSLAGGWADDNRNTHRLERSVEELQAALRALSPDARTLLDDMADPETWSAAVPMLRQMRANPTVRTERARTDAKGWAAELRGLATEIDQFAVRHGALLERVSPAAQFADVRNLRDNLRTAQAAGMLKRKRLVASALAEVQALVPGVPVDETVVPRILGDIEYLQRESFALRDRVRRALPGWVSPDVLSAAAVGRRVAGDLDGWRQTREAFGATDVLDAYVAKVAREEVDPFADAGAIEAVAEAWKQLRQAFGVTAASQRRWLRGRTVVQAIEQSVPTWCDNVASGLMGEYRRTRDMETALRNLRAAGFDELAAELEQGEHRDDDLHASVRSSLALAVQEERVDATGLARFSAEERRRSIDALDASASAMRGEAVKALPSLVRQRNGVDRESRTNELAALRSEYQRKSGGSIRELVGLHGEALQRVTPCFLMSPTSVARYLPVGALTFDLVIFDEASQIRVADAIGALGRARAAVVVGDSQQMPPTSMFATASTEEESDVLADGLAAPVDQDSILQECVDSNIRSLGLTWHYRSQDESLIAFSNRAYYKDELASFPMPPAQRVGYGVEFQRLNGTFEGGAGASRTNRVEAEAVVAEVERRLLADPRASIGVVTFNIQQRDVILDLLEAKAGVVREAMIRSDDAIFVKNLENVQGDERDVILFSLAYAPNPDTGRLNLNFGPLTADGGERRLNVAITRARRSIKVFASFDPEHIDLSRSRSRGLRDLRDYLLFARGERPESEHSVAGSLAELHRSSIASALRVAGLEVRELVGLSGFKVDLAARVPDSEQWVGVLLDGEDWARRATATDRDVLPAAVLSGPMGWPAIERIWLPEWMLSAHEAVERVRTAAHRIAAQVVTTAAVESPGAFTEMEQTENPAPAPTLRDGGPDVLSADLMGGGATAPLDGPGADGVEPVLQRRSPISAPAATSPSSSKILHAKSIERRPFRSAVSERVVMDGALDRLNDPSIRAIVQHELEDVVATEGPIESQRLVGITARRFGLMKAHRPRWEALMAMIPPERQTREGESTFVWGVAQDPGTYELVRSSAQSGRDITEISTPELRNAVRFVLRSGPQKRTWVRQLVCDTFGYRRQGSRITARLDEVIDGLMVEGLITQEGVDLRLPAES
ncbi:DUF4011 domain-containing protein [Calidifontibacter terrae]